MNPQVEYVHTIMEIQYINEQHEQPNVVEDFQYPQDIDRAATPLHIVS